MSGVVLAVFIIMAVNENIRVRLPDGRVLVLYSTGRIVMERSPGVRVKSSEPLLLTVNEAASVLGISRSMIYKLFAADEVPSVKMGRSRRVPRSGLDDYIKRQT